MKGTDAYLEKSFTPASCRTTSSIQKFPVNSFESLVKISYAASAMADAAYEILTKDSKEFTGNFCIDDVVLHEAGVKDFSKYASVPFNELMPDFFVPEDTPLPEDVKNS